MNMRIPRGLALVVLAMASAKAAAGTINGPAGSLVLPDDITAAIRPANAAHPNPAASVVATLTQASSATSGPVELTMSCLPAVGHLAKKDGLERLSAASLQVDKAATLDRPGEWIEIDGLRAFHTDASRRDGTRLTQWMIAREGSIAWVKYDRPRDVPMEQTVLQAVSAMKVLCATSMADVEKAAQAASATSIGAQKAPAAKLTLPTNVMVTEALGPPALPNIGPSTVFTLTGPEPDAVPVTVTMTCEKTVGRLEPFSWTNGIEPLASVSFSSNKNLKRKRGGVWYKIGVAPVYRTQGVYDDGRRLTQWMLPLVTAFAWITFERPEGAPLEQTVLDAVENMTVQCGPLAPDETP